MEQAEFRDLSVTASQAGCQASLTSYRAGSKTTRSVSKVTEFCPLILHPDRSNFKPDFLLVRQNLKDAGENYKNLLLGFRYGGVPSLNSVHSIYNFQVGIF